MTIVNCKGVNSGRVLRLERSTLVLQVMTGERLAASCKSLGSCSEKVVYTKHTRLLLFGIQLCASVTLL
jgi:hypothetical protein